MLKKSAALSLFLLMLIAGCGKKAPVMGSDGVITQPTPAVGGSQKAAEPVYQKVHLGPLKTGEVAKVGTLDVQVAETGMVTRATGLLDGYAYLLLRLTITNNGLETYTANLTYQFKLTPPDGKLLLPNYRATAYRSPILQGSPRQGEKIDGWIGFLVKPGDGTYTFTFNHPDYGDATWELGKFTAQ